MNKAVFLDRDGTINVEKNYLYKKEDFEFIDGAIEGLKLLQDNGYLLIVVTNQSGIARGYYTEEDFKILNDWMLKELRRQGVRIEEVYYCPHHPEAIVEKFRINCDCRKPLTGLFKKAIDDLDIEIDSSWAIGDKIRDCSICETTGCKGILIERDERKEIIEKVKSGEYKNVRYANNLLDAAKIITEEKQ